MITYSEFVRIRRQEQEDNRTLTKLNDGLYDEMKEYIAINKNSFDEARNIDDQRKMDEIAMQIKNALNTLDQIINIRIIKISNMAVLGINSEEARGNMMSKELILFDNLLDVINKHKSELLDHVRNVEPKKLQKVESDPDSEKTIIKVIADIPKFIWRNNKSYGPFGFPNVIEIDTDVADILIKSGKAVGV